MKQVFFFQNQMRPGDKVRIVIQDPIDHETKDWLRMDYEDIGLKYPNDIAIIDEVLIAEDGTLVKLRGGSYYIHPGHFEVIIKEKKMKLKGKEIMELSIWLQEAADNKGQKFAYAVAKNLTEVNKKVKELASIKEKTKDYQKFDEKRVKLAEKYADKGANGKALIANSNYVITTKRKEWDKAFKEFSKENKKVLDAYKQQLKNYNKALEKEYEVDVYKINKEDLSEDITANQLIGLAVLIEE